MMRARDALILYLVAKRSQGRLIWSDSTAEFYYEETGRPVDGRTIRATWSDYVADAQSQIERSTESMLAQRISVEEYRNRLRGYAKDMIRLGYMTGRGGHAQMTNNDWLAVARQVKAENHYIDRFADQLNKGEAGTEGQIRVRGKMYGQAGYRSVELGQRSAKETAGYTEERRNAVMDNNTCGRCAELAGRGWQPIGSLPLPGEDTPCGGNCRCEMEYRGNPVQFEAEAEYLYDKLIREYEASGFSGFTYDVNTGEEPAEGFALSIYPERDRWISMDNLHTADLRDFAQENADLLLDQTKFRHRFGGWTENDKLCMDVSIVVPPDQIERAASYVMRYNQLAMWSLHDSKEIGRQDCIDLLQSAGMLPADYEDPMKKSTKSTKRPKGRRALFFQNPVLAGRKDPETGERVTFAQQTSWVVDLAQHIHEETGARHLTARGRLEFVIREYRAHEEHDIEKFWRLRPDLRPSDWAEQKDKYMGGDGRAWERLAWED